MKRVTQKVLNNAIERFNTMKSLGDKEIFESKYDVMPRLFIREKKTDRSVFIFEGTKSQCCQFLLSLSAFIIANEVLNK